MRPLAAVGVVVAGIFAFFLIKSPESRPHARGPQLVSVEALPASGDYCEPGYDALPQQTNLFDAFGETSVSAGSQ